MSSVTRLWIARHGEVVGHEHQRFNGHNDVDITDRGVEQMHWIAEELGGEGITAVHTSDLTRARRGGALIAERLGVPLHAHAALRELCHGDLDGMLVHEGLREYPDLIDRLNADPESYRFPRGETLGEVRDRVLAAVDAIASRHAGEAVLILSHLGPSRVLLLDAMGLPLGAMFRLRLDYGSLSRLERDAKEVTVHLINKTMESPGRRVTAGDDSRGEHRA